MVLRLNMAKPWAPSHISEVAKGMGIEKRISGDVKKTLVEVLNLELKKITNKKANIVRAIPMPPISLGKGPVALYPPNKKVKNFFDNIGTSIEIKSEKLSNNFWAISGTMASFYELLKVLSDWLIKRGLKKSDAQRYVISLYSALAQLAEVHSSKNLKKFVLESQTPGGLNWQGVNELRKSGYFKSLEKSVNNILKRLNKA